MNTEEKNSNIILYVDDEEAWRMVFKRNLKDAYEVITAKNADEGWDILQKRSDEIAIIVSDQRMPGRPGIELLKQARAYYPRIIRILTTGFSDSTIAINATNQGAVYHYISKPWNGDELFSILKRAMDFHLIRQERDNLLERKLSSIQRKNLEGKLQCLLVFGESKDPEIRNAAAAMENYLEGIFEDPGKIFNLKSIYKNSQNELSILSGYFKIIQQLMEVSQMLKSVAPDCEVDIRKVLLSLRDKHPQIIFSVYNLDTVDRNSMNAGEKVVSHYLDSLVGEWMINDGNKKLLEISERNHDSTGSGAINGYRLKIGYFNDPVPYAGSDDDQLYNGVNFTEDKELVWLRFLLIIHHFGGSVVPEILSSERISFSISEFKHQAELGEVTSERVLAQLLKKFEAWNYADLMIPETVAIDTPSSE